MEDLDCRSEEDCFNMLHKLILILQSGHLDQALWLCIDLLKVMLNLQSDASPVILTTPSSCYRKQQMYFQFIVL